jgi:ammonia channel protein AmtB
MNDCIVPLFGGGIVVHITAGFSALATVIALPHRRKLENHLDTDPHNIPFVALGTVWRYKLMYLTPSAWSV